MTCAYALPKGGQARKRPTWPTGSATCLDTMTTTRTPTSSHPVTAISDDGSAVTPEILDQVFDNVKDSGLYLIEHCEHHDTRAVNEGPVSRELGVPAFRKTPN